MNSLLPALRGVIDRRILVNFRIDPAVIEQMLPTRFRPQTVDGYAIGGLCCIALDALRPPWIPPRFGLKSENQAHQFPVEWKEDGVRKTGVYIPHRHSDSWVNRAFGGRLFPGNHYDATFDVTNEGQRWTVAMDGEHASVHVEATLSDELPADSVFDTVGAASSFVESDTIGYSPTRENGELEPVELVTEEWEMSPLSIERVKSSFLDQFPDEAYTVDHALWMESIDHRWLATPR